MKIKWNILSVICAIGAIAVAIMGLTGYLSGLGLLGSIRKNYIPIAPSSAISFFVIGGILLFLNLKQLSRARSFIFWVIIFLVSLFAMLDVIGYFIGADLNFEESLLPDAGNLNGIPIGRMSPATGTAFFLSGIVVFLLILQRRMPEHSKLFEYFGGWLSILVLMISFVFCLAYMYGSPLLYRYDNTVPMALTTALGFLLLSTIPHLV